MLLHDTTTEFVPIETWSPSEWALAHFPLPAEQSEVVSVAAIVDSLLLHLNGATDFDTTYVCQTLHCAHMLKTLQNTGGLWPARVNLRTGTVLGKEQTSAPVRLFKRLNVALNSTEFDYAIQAAEMRGG